MPDQEQDQQQQQSNIRQQANVAQGGLNLDASIGQVPKGKLTYALNAAIENFDSTSINYQNESGNELCLQFPTDYHLIGQHFIAEQNKHIFFLTNPETGGSEIGYMVNNDCVYHTYINAACLAFSIEHPIHKAIHKITNCSTEIYWTDGINPRRYLDLDPEKKPFFTELGPDGCTFVPTNVIDCNKIKIQPNFSIPSLTIKKTVNGGTLLSGTYQFAIQYCDVAGDGYTSYYSVTNPLSIANPQVTTADFNYPVGKSIVVDIANIDTTGYFAYFNLAVIKTVNDIESVELIGTYTINTTTKSITYTGQNKTSIPLTIGDIFEKFPYYEIADDLTAVQDVIVWKGLTSIDRINYQKIANKIALQWETYRIPNTETYADPHNTANLKGYLRDEVYPFEIVFLLKNGKQTDAFHIPGRAKNNNENYPDVPNTNADFIGYPTNPDGVTSPYWQIYNTGSKIGDAPGKSNSVTYKGPWEYGDFAYWESTETYPCNVSVWGDLAGQPIRHHKFPDVLVSPIFETPVYALSPGFQPIIQKDAIYPIGVKINIAQVYELIQVSDLTTDQKADIIAFKIIRGDRSANKSIVAKGILRNVGKYTRDIPNAQGSTYYYYPNYPFNDLNPDPFLLDQNNAYNAQCITYQVVTTAATILQYTNCYTGNVDTLSLLANTITPVGSLTYPQVQSGTATITVTSGYSYILSCTQNHSFTTFEYTNSSTLALTTVVVTNGLPVTVSSTTYPVKIIGSNQYTILITSTTNPAYYPNKLNGFGSTESKYRHVFNSPETSFAQPVLGDTLKIESVLFGGGKGHFVQVKKHAMYKLLSQAAQQEALASSANIATVLGTLDSTGMFTAYQAYLNIYINGITRKNYTYSFNSIGSYDYSADVQNGIGIKQRSLDIYQYLIPGIQSVGESNGININNYNRESSVYLKTVESRAAITIDPLPFPNQTPSLVVGGSSPISDNSRFTISDKNNCNVPETQVDTTVISYYGSIKNTIVNQWGQIYSYPTVDTGFQQAIDLNTILNLSLNADQVFFGGDTFISKFAFKTKLPFFIDNRVGAPDDSDIFYDELGNVAYPQYWYSARSILNDYVVPTGSTPKVLKNIISYKAHYFDCPSSTIPNLSTTTTSTTYAPGLVIPSDTNTYYDGKMYLFAYGIPSFYCESGINVDLRQAFNNQDGDFYPHVSSGIPDNWLQESVVPIGFDNTYYYNPTFSKQNSDNAFSHLPENWTSQLCYTNFPFRAIYSDPQQSYSDNRINSWLIYRPVSFFDFPQNYGKFVSIDGIQNKAILTRFENKSFVYNTMLTVNTSNPQAAYLGNDTLFRSSPPVDFAETNVGYMGTQNKMLLKIPQGQISIDAKRGQVFLVTKGMYGLYNADDLVAMNSGVNKFFTNHLPFEILKYFPTVDTDNHFNGVGLHGVYDTKYDRMIISKLDYIPLNNSVLYDSVAKKFYVNKTYGSTTLKSYIELTDRNYFCNKSWTISFSFDTKSWISFHSYIPNFYVAENNFFYSGLNEGCDLTAIAIQEIPTPSTTTTTTTFPDCSLAGTAVDACGVDGNAVYISNTTTTTTTTININCKSYSVTNNTGTNLQLSYIDCCTGLIVNTPTISNGDTINNIHYNDIINTPGIIITNLISPYTC